MDLAILFRKVINVYWFETFFYNHRMVVQNNNSFIFYAFHKLLGFFFFMLSKNHLMTTHLEQFSTAML